MCFVRNIFCICTEVRLSPYYGQRLMPFRFFTLTGLHRGHKPVYLKKMADTIIAFPVFYHKVLVKHWKSTEKKLPL